MKRSISMKQDYANMISIIVPVYNVNRYIKDALDAILNQSYGNFEIILVNDGSTDGSDVICDQYASRDKRIRVIHQKNSGVSVARNAGLRATNGGYITFIDSDDAIVPTYLDVLKRQIDQTGADIVKCDIERFVEVSDELFSAASVGAAMIKGSKQDLIDILYCKSTGKWGGPGAKLYRASLLIDTWFDTSMSYDEDFDFLCYAVNKANKICTIEFGGYLYRVRPGSAMQSGFKSKMLESIEKRLKELDGDKEVRRAQKTNILLNAMFRFALISDHTQRFSIEKARLWRIIVELRRDALFDISQRIDHKASTIASYFGKNILARVIRLAKGIQLASEDERA